MKRIICLTLILCSILLCSCSEKKPDTTSFQAMDTVMSLTVYGDTDISDKLKDRINELDRIFDATDENSEIYRLNKDKTAEVSADAKELLSRSLGLCEGLNGCFDITVYPAVLEWGFTTGDYKIPDDETLSKLAKRIDHTSVRSDGDTFSLSNDAMLDLGAVAKGYAADVCTAMLKESDAKAAVLNLGGTVAMYGKKPDGSPFRVGIADPKNPAGYFGYLSCKSGVLATSGGYERYFTADDGTVYIHILDPKTARPVDNGIQSVTIFSESGTDADALSTALFVMGLDKAEQYYRANSGFDFIILTENELYITEGIYDDFTLADGFGFKLNKVV